MKTMTAVCTMRLVVKSGNWAARLSSAVSSTSSEVSLTEPSSDTWETLPVREALQGLEASIDAVDQRLGKGLALADDGEEGRSGREVGDVVLAEVDEGEAEGQGIG